MRTEIQKRKVAKQEKQNSGFKKGDHVVMHTCMEAEEHDGTVWTCSSDEYKLHKNHDYNVVMLEGFSGAFQTQYLQKVHFSYPQEVTK
ncbi:hypothetical protein C0431_12925 [bacterium]|nr:hypothetical protein [bacterium]